MPSEAEAVRRSVTAGPAAPLPAMPMSQAGELLEALFLEDTKPVAMFDAPDPELLAVRLLTALWPSLRRRFALSTFALSPRKVDGRDFDLVFAPRDARSSSPTGRDDASMAGGPGPPATSGPPHSPRGCSGRAAATAGRPRGRATRRRGAGQRVPPPYRAPLGRVAREGGRVADRRPGSHGHRELRAGPRSRSRRHTRTGPCRSRGKRLRVPTGARCLGVRGCGRTQVAGAHDAQWQLRPRRGCGRAGKPGSGGAVSLLAQADLEGAFAGLLPSIAIGLGRETAGLTELSLRDATPDVLGRLIAEGGPLAKRVARDAALVDRLPTVISSLGPLLAAAVGTRLLPHLTDDWQHALAWPLIMELDCPASSTRSGASARPTGSPPSVFPGP